MTVVMGSAFINVHPSKAKANLFHDGNCFVIASTVSAYSLQSVLVRVLVDGSTRSVDIALYDHCSSRFHIAFHGL
jgi:hypothetical protein